MLNLTFMALELTLAYAIRKYGIDKCHIKQLPLDIYSLCKYLYYPLNFQGRQSIHDGVCVPTCLNVCLTRNRPLHHPWALNCNQQPTISFSLRRVCIVRSLANRSSCWFWMRSRLASNKSFNESSRCSPLSVRKFRPDSDPNSKLPFHPSPDCAPWIGGFDLSRDDTRSNPISLSLLIVTTQTTNIDVLRF